MNFSDEDLMAVALSEAVKVSKRSVLPNPRVGAAILTREGRLYFGHHRRAGEAHAEVEAMNTAIEAGASLVGATIAVTLEPCSHQGRTPPCADALIRAGFSRVLVGTTDTDARVSGSGVAKLEAAGIDVVKDVLASRCIEVNREWLFAKANDAPYVYLKMATSLDGLWTAEDGSSQWITGPEARAHAHRLRAEVGAIVTSLKTIATDDPLYTARDEQGQNLPDQPDLVVLSRQASWTAAWENKVYRAQQVPGREVHAWNDTERLAGILKRLYQDGHHACLVEAGPELSSAFLQQNLVQEVWHYQGARYLGGNGLRLRALAAGKLPGVEVSVADTTTFANGDTWFRLRTFNRP